MTREKIDVEAAFLQPWKPSTHIITYGRYLDEHQKIGKAIGTHISDTDKILKLVVQMYARKYFTEEHMMAYKCHQNYKKYNWNENLKYFTDLYSLQKEYYKD